jgi:hypothetical protein
MAAQLVVPRLWSLFHIYTAEAFGAGERMGYGADNLAYQRHTEEWIKGEPPPVFDESAVAHLLETHAALGQLDRGNHPGAWRALELFGLFARMPLVQLFDPLAMFMLIEMLLTHNPNDKEIGDSLTHQVRHKIPFVFERNKERIDYSEFGNASADTVWKALYKYRSRIAHGGNPDFGSELQVLRNADTANRFLTDVTRRLIRFSIYEPTLCEGLKPL